MTVVLLEPNNARARPSTLISDNARYEQIFNKKHQLSLYLNSYLILKKCSELLKEYEFESKRDFNNVIYHISMAVVLKVAGAEVGKRNMPGFVSGFELKEITKELFDEVFQVVWGEYARLGGDDNVAKGIVFVENIIKLIK